MWAMMAKRAEMTVDELNKKLDGYFKAAEGDPAITADYETCVK